MSVKPIVVAKRIVIEGGLLKSPWMPAAQTIEGIEWINLSTQDRQLCKLLGRNMSERAPLAECTLFPWLMAERDRLVDELIAKRKTDEDPLAECDAPVPEIPSSGRVAAFANARVDNYVRVQAQHFCTPGGERVDDFEIKVLTTPKRKAAISIEASAANLEWLCKASQVVWEIAHVRKEDRKKYVPRVEIDDEDNLPTLETPLKYRKLADGRLELYVHYRTQDGSWKTHQSTVLKALADFDAYARNSIIQQCAASVLKWYGENHVEDEDEDPSNTSVDREVTMGQQ